MYGEAFVVSRERGTAQFSLVPVFGRKAKSPAVLGWGAVYAATIAVVVGFVLLLNFIFVLYPEKVASYNMATVIDTSPFVQRLNQMTAQITPEIRVYKESSRLEYKVLKVLYGENVRLREDNDLAQPSLTPADAMASKLNLNSAVFGNPAIQAERLVRDSETIMSKQDILTETIPFESQKSEDIAWFKAHTPSCYPVYDGATRDRNPGFGWRIHPILRTADYHTGIDIEGIMGEPMYAVADGVVTSVGWNGGYGLMVKIKHRVSPLIETLYAHNSKNLVEVGDVVKRGDIIAYIGSTGMSTGPHIHFEVREGGKPIDPETFIRKNSHCGELPPLEDANGEESND